MISFIHDELANWKYCHADCHQSPNEVHSTICSTLSRKHEEARINVISPFKPNPSIPSWLPRAMEVHKFVSSQMAERIIPFSLADARELALGLAGEAGEVAQLIHKFGRDHVPSGVMFGKLLKELADVRIYAAMLSIFAGDASDGPVQEKLEEVVDRWRLRGLKLGPPDYNV